MNATILGRSAARLWIAAVFTIAAPWMTSLTKYVRWKNAVLSAKVARLTRTAAVGFAAGWTPKIQALGNVRRTELAEPKEKSVTTAIMLAVRVSNALEISVKHDDATSCAGGASSHSAQAVRGIFPLGISGTSLSSSMR